MSAKGDFFVKILNTATALVHFGSFLITLIYVANGKDAKYDLTYTKLVYYENAPPMELENYVSREFGNSLVVQTIHRSGIYISVGGAICAFFLLSAIFQILFLGRMRYIEYSVSASLMILVLSLQSGIWDAYTLFCQFFLTFGCMICGYFADILFSLEEQYPGLNKIAGKFRIKMNNRIQEYGIPMYWLVHSLGWVLMLAAYVVLWCSFGVAYKENEENVPAFVLPMVAVQSLLFLFFGITQILQFTKTLSMKQTQIAFIVQSLISKSILAWVIFAEVLMQTPRRSL